MPATPPRLIASVRELRVRKVLKRQQNRRAHHVMRQAGATPLSEVKIFCVFQDAEQLGSHGREHQMGRKELAWNHSTTLTTSQCWPASRCDWQSCRRLKEHPHGASQVQRSHGTVSTSGYSEHRYELHSHALPNLCLSGTNHMTGSL